MVNVVMTALVYLLTMVMSYILKRAGLFHKEDKKVLSNLIFYITLPASLISSFAGAEVNVYYVIAILLGFLVNTVMVISGQIVSADKSPELKAIYSVNASGFNMACIAIPFLSTFYPAGVPYLCMFDVGDSFYTLGTTYAIGKMRLNGGSKDKNDNYVLTILKGLLTSVPFDTYMIMTILSFLNCRLPDFITMAADFCGKGNGFLTMIMIGVSLELHMSRESAKEKELILKVQSIVEKGASKEKIGLRGAMPQGYLFAVYDSETQEAEYIPPEYNEIPELLDELVEYVNTTDDHPLIIAAIVHYQIVTIHAFEDGNGRTARLLSGYILDYYGYGFQGIGSLEEYFAYDSDEYYSSLQMGLPALYYMGRENPPHPEIWITYFLRMMELYSNKVCELSMETNKQSEQVNLSYLNKKDKELLAYLIENKMYEFKPVDVAGALKVTNKTVINRCAKLYSNGFVVPVITGVRIMAYRLTDYTISNADTILKNIL